MGILESSILLLFGFYFLGGSDHVPSLPERKNDHKGILKNIFNNTYLENYVLRAPWSDFNFRGHFGKLYTPTVWILIFWGFGPRTLPISAAQE